MSAPAAAIRLLFATLDASGLFPVPPGELSVAILPAEEMTALHADFLDDASPTDVITFEGDSAHGTAGEICVCADVAREYAGQHQLDFPRELTLYLVHGYLHLAGFDDLNPAAKRKMRTAEKRALAVLDAAGVIPAFVWKRRRAKK